MDLDAEDNVWCPSCRRGAGTPCAVTKAETARVLAAAKDGAEVALKGLHVDHDGRTLVHLARIRRADQLADGDTTVTWRRDELMSIVGPLAANGGLTREGRVQ